MLNIIFHLSIESDIRFKQGLLVFLRLSLYFIVYMYND